MDKTLQEALMYLDRILLENPDIDPDSAEGMELEKMINYIENLEIHMM